MRYSVLIGVLFLGLTVMTANAQNRGSLVNFKHLDHLTETILFQGDSVDIVHVYANAPDYGWVGAQESGMEGIACVDDVARAAVLYLRHFELNKDEQSRAKAIRLLKFVKGMETPDGNFYNFLLHDYSINRDGKTSFKSFGWWACRGVWAMAMGARILKTTEPAFADSLAKGVERTFPHIDTLLVKYPDVDTIKGFVVPRWLLYDGGTDVTSELLLGLDQYYRYKKSARVKYYLEKFSEAFMIMQAGDAATHPYGVHLSWQTYWHMWGNGQSQALASIGMLLHNRKMISSAEREATGWYSRLLIDGYLKELDLSDRSKVTRYEQIAYAVRPMALGLLRVSAATGKSEYQKMAGLAASWFFSNNVLGAVMYDSVSGRGYDGIRDSASINMNSGAESTIEALMTMTELEHSPLARKYSKFRKESSGETTRYRYASFVGPANQPALLVVDLKKHGRVSFYEGAAKTRFMKSIESKSK